MLNKNIVAIGGGGFGRSLGELKIEKYITSLVKKDRPKICFIPTASGDNDLYKLNFYRAFSKLNCITSHLDFFSRTENLEKKFYLKILLCWWRKYKKYVSGLERMESAEYSESWL